ncbi:MAG: ATP-binding cassette domain-containing protein [Caldilineaceae bacterium SB0664_bin_27]|uniref:ATP-binding cassette domain-containing protein n=1 Tax=Caldilineaceae bacterium SB0664_bin_27 TaxID=2605260 RepID=A0A6B0Z081_9CHLR|nr:ATP-binding cassette domain-containing protein [Caldilineaceae bacterium SB0664_bin_27]
MKGDNAVVTSSLSRSFGTVKAVESVNLSIPGGEIYGFLGPNGAGKTSVVRMLTTLLLPTSGSARVAGHDVVTEPTAVRLKSGAPVPVTCGCSAPAHTRFLRIPPEGPASFLSPFVHSKLSPTETQPYPQSLLSLNSFELSLNTTYTYKSDHRPNMQYVT